MDKLRVMTIVFNTPLKQSEIRKFRGAVIQSAGIENTLFHNHREQGYDYRYPLIQYRIKGGRAAMICINSGIEQIQSLFTSKFIGSDIMIGDENKGEVVIDSIRQKEYSLREIDTPIRYHISRWLPLNQHNYKAWKEADNDADRVSMLNSIMTGNIMSFAKGIGWHIENKIECSIDVDTVVMRQISYKDQKLVSFSLDFTANIFLPAQLGLGKGVSFNCGVISVGKEVSYTE